MADRGFVCDINRIRRSVAEFVTRAGFDWAGLKAAGIAVPLTEMVDGHPLCLVEVRRLTPASVSSHLAKRGLSAPVTGERPGRALAGFVYGDSSRAFIFLNRDDPFARRRFSLAHEIGHFMLHGGGALARATARPGPVPLDDEPEVLRQRLPRNWHNRLNAAEASALKGAARRTRLSYRAIWGKIARIEALAKWIAERFHLAGFVGDVRPWLARADALLLTSLFEGTPNVVRIR